VKVSRGGSGSSRNCCSCFGSASEQ